MLHKKLTIAAVTGMVFGSAALAGAAITTSSPDPVPTEKIVSDAPAADPSLTPGDDSVDAPEVETTEVEAPEVETPEVETPDAPDAQDDVEGDGQGTPAVSDPQGTVADDAQDDQGDDDQGEVEDSGDDDQSDVEDATEADDADEAEVDDSADAADASDHADDADHADDGEDDDTQAPAAAQG